MPFFRVVKGHDAYWDFEAIVEAADMAAAIERAEEEEDTDWVEAGMSGPYDDYEIFHDRCEEVSKTDAEEFEAKKGTCEYTVFCQQSNGRGTIWISSMNATSVADAREQGQIQCAHEWDYDNEQDVHVLGVALGNIDIKEWDDLNT